MEPKLKILSLCVTNQILWKCLINPNNLKNSNFKISKKQNMYLKENKL